MDKVNRFIQFNDESVETRKILLYERIAQSLANAPFVKITERQLIEYQPKDATFAMSVFWRHRSEQVTHLGRLSDIYLLAAGFYKQFDLAAWKRFAFEMKTSRHPKLAGQIMMLLEEFRLMEAIQRTRVGTKRAFAMRIEVYAEFHKDRLLSNAKRGFLSDAFINQLFLDIHTGMTSSPHESLHQLPMERVRQVAQSAYELKTTSQSGDLAKRIMDLVEEQLTGDSVLPLYTFGESFEEGKSKAMSARAMSDPGESDNQELKETIEEEFRAWHRETEEGEGTHLEFELQQGKQGAADASESSPGDENAEAQQLGLGSSEGNDKEGTANQQSEIAGDRLEQTSVKAGSDYGAAHRHVTFSVTKISNRAETISAVTLTKWRNNHLPIVRALVTEMKKRLERKKQLKRENLTKGRLSSKLTSMLTDERPRPFYRKQAPSQELDAVFGLLVDGSASMIDKVEETKEAVVLFHDVLRKLHVSHEITTYYEDAFEATKDVQPNFFEVMHTFDETHVDSGQAIMNFEAHEDNRDGFAIRWMADRLAGRSEQHKFLLIFSDGEPSAFGYDRNGIVDTAEAVWETEKRGISVVHLFLSAEKPTDDQKELFATMFGNKTAASDSVEEFANETLRILRKLLAIAAQ
ncbi:vWA domain-containing protein [Sporosarcina gallistercoris]|uniref:VWA domain-containing protein n=1 Tax=Sporosarcina gallistercoris TaxID=2762245 RepID=A0ABR8PJH9_9BACL|nr:VWA domain-containing protein [Sporosarcina gallistercoris]MBD7908314.1 VWA domain-containing protein [Sporosarcina gallistercoris]